MRATVHALGQRGLAFLQGQDALFDGALGDEFVDEHLVRLADAVGAVGGLVFYRRVPPRVVVDDSVGLRQVQTDPTGFEADQEQRYFARGESVYQFIAFLGLTGELDPGNIAYLELVLNQREHAGELRKQ